MHDVTLQFILKNDGNVDVKVLYRTNHILTTCSLDAEVLEHLANGLVLQISVPGSGTVFQVLPLTQLIESMEKIDRILVFDHK